MTFWVYDKQFHYNWHSVCTGCRSRDDIIGYIHNGPFVWRQSACTRHTYPPFIVPPHTLSPSLFHSQLTDLMVVIQAMPPLCEAWEKQLTLSDKQLYGRWWVGYDLMHMITHDHSLCKYKLLFSNGQHYVIPIGLSFNVVCTHYLPTA